MLDIYAGEHARQQLLENGFSASHFSAMFGASGGPKWFTLFGLDKYLFGEFFKNRTTPLDLVGSSAGAFRFAALSQDNPVDAITKLAKTYSTTVYSSNADANEVTTKALELIEAVYQEDGIKYATNNSIFRPHFIVAKCHGLTASQNKYLQLAGLLGSVMLNRIDRGLLRHQYQRFVFRPTASDLTIADQHQFNTQYHSLSQHNFKQALLASGSIPMVMNSVNKIDGAPNGVYRDGGIIDYHFDIALPENQGLILYPHFNHSPKPGWFDKNLIRPCQQKHYKNVVMLAPSQAFVASLPFNKIPDRKDFTDMDATTRIKYWQQVLKQTEQLADSLHHVIDKQATHLIKPLAFV